MVNTINDSPKAQTDYAQTPHATPLFGIDVLANDTDPENDRLRVVEANSADGEVRIGPDGTLSFFPTEGFSGIARIVYRILDRAENDPEALKDVGEVIVQVGKAGGGPPVVPPPAKGGDGIVTGTEGADVIDLGYDGDPDGDRVDAGDALLPGHRPDDDVIRAGGGDDFVTAGAGDDAVDGGAGNDRISAEDGRDTVWGGDGDDVIYTGGPALAPDQGYPYDPSDGIGFAGDADPEDDRDLVDAGAGNDIVRTGDDRDTISGGSGDDTVYAGIDDDSVSGGAGDDLLVGGEGRDTLLGEAGDDRLYGGNMSGDPLDFFNIPDVARADAPYSPDRNPENGRDYLHGGAGDDRLYGADDDDTLMGGEGNDLLEGQLDDDVLNGGAGNDTLSGGEGADTLMGGAGRDLITDVTAGDVVLGGSTGEDFDVLDLRDADGNPVRARITYTSEDREDGIVSYLDEDGAVTGFLTFSDIESVVNCFTPGTRIATPQGERAVEALKVGDSVITRDNGMQEIRWIGSRSLSPAALAVSGHLQPIFIRAGALGNGLPLRDMMVSPNHRMLMVSDRTALYFEEREVLVAAKFLTDLPGVMQARVAQTTYYHLMFDRHEVILSDGSWTESFQPGDMSLAGVDSPQRRELFELFPELAREGGSAGFLAARKSLKKFEAKLLTG